MFLEQNYINLGGFFFFLFLWLDCYPPYYRDESFACTIGKPTLGYVSGYPSFLVTSHIESFMKDHLHTLRYIRKS